MKKVEQNPVWEIVEFWLEASEKGIWDLVEYWLEVSKKPHPIEELLKEELRRLRRDEF